MSVYFTSDLHFGHFNIIGYCNRPFSDVHSMNVALTQNWNSVVEPEDTIYCLGDFSMNHHKAANALSLLNGYKILISGNHDKCWKGQETYIDFYKEAGFAEVYTRKQFPMIDLLGTKFRMSHLPYDVSDGRYESFLPEDDGVPLLCGHVHDRWSFKRSKKGTPMINVGVDQWELLPVSSNTLKEYFESVVSSKKEEDNTLARLTSNRN